MSAAGETAEEIANGLPITPEEAQIIADSLRPVQDLTGVGSSIGSAMEQAPGSGPKLLGAFLQHGAAQAQLMSVSVETIARAISFYIDAQTQTAEELFPPPEVLAKQIKGDIEPVGEFAGESFGVSE